MCMAATMQSLPCAPRELIVHGLSCFSVGLAFLPAVWRPEPASFFQIPSGQPQADENGHSSLNKTRASTCLGVAGSPSLRTQGRRPCQCCPKLWDAWPAPGRAGSPATAPRPPTMLPSSPPPQVCGCSVLRLMLASTLLVSLAVACCRVAQGAGSRAVISGQWC